MTLRRLLGFGLCAALAGAQPGCARQLTNSEVALGVTYAAMFAGMIYVGGVASECKFKNTCPTRSSAGDDTQARVRPRGR
jgi:hypothetical protein